VREIRPNGPPGASTVIINSNGKIVYCNTGPQWAERLMRMNAGDEIGLVGRIAQYQSGGPFFMEECDIT
jgi:hypothetical protein